MGCSLLAIQSVIQEHTGHKRILHCRQLDQELAVFHLFPELSSAGKTSSKTNLE